MGEECCFNCSFFYVDFMIQTGYCSTIEDLGMTIEDSKRIKCKYYRRKEDEKR